MIPKGAPLALTDVSFLREEGFADKFLGVRVALVSPEGKRSVVADSSLLPYFYIKPREKSPDSFGEIPEITGTREVEKFLRGERTRLLQVIASSPAQVPMLREKLAEKGEIFEADIPYLRRYTIDKGLRPFDGISPKILALDIETLSKDGTPVPDSKRDPIIMASYALLTEKGIADKGVLSSVGKTLPGFVRKVDSEKSLLETLFSLVTSLDPDIIVGYNSDNFDLPYISERAKRLGIVPAIGIDGGPLSFRKRGRMGGTVPEVFGRQILDIYVFVRFIVSHTMHTQTLDLGSVSMEILGEGKDEVDFSLLPKLIEKDDLGKFAGYSLKDAVLTARLAEKFVPIILELSKFLCMLPSDVGRMTSGQIVEAFLIKESGLEGRIVPNRPALAESEERNLLGKFEGAFVREPEKGLHERVAVCDFRSLYPSIIISHNIDPDTIGPCPCCPKNTSPTNDHFCLNKFGIVPRSLLKIVRERKVLKGELRKLKPGTSEYVSLDAKQNALKLVSNSFYGYIGYQNSRWFSYEGARSTAGWGRKYIHETISLAEKSGFRVLYGDTDSLFFSASSLSAKEPGARDFKVSVGEFVSKVNEALPGEMELELQGIYKRGVFLTKKRYAMLDFEGRIVIKGLERVRRDWAGVARKTQEKVLLAILGDASPEKAMEIIRFAVDSLRKRQIDKEDLAIYTQLTKRPGQYKVTSPHVEAAKLSGLPVKAGTVVKFVVVKGKGSISSRARPFEKAGIDDYDPEYYVDNQLLPAVMRIMEALGYTEEAFKKQGNLESFFE